MFAIGGRWTRHPRQQRWWRRRPGRRPAIVFGDDYLDGGAGDDTEGNNTIQLASANGLATVNALSITDSTTLKVALDNGEKLTLQNAPFGMNATLQFANGEVLDLETLVGTTLATPLYLALDDSGGRVYGGGGD